MNQPDAFRKFYLGDGAYVEVSDGSLLLTTDRSHECFECDRSSTITHSIYLEPFMMDALVEYYNAAKAQAAAMQKEKA